MNGSFISILTLVGFLVGKMILAFSSLAFLCNKADTAAGTDTVTFQAALDPGNVNYFTFTKPVF
jgi:hypothetical protein